MEKYMIDTCGYFWGVIEENVIGSPIGEFKGSIKRIVNGMVEMLYDPAIKHPINTVCLITHDGNYVPLRIALNRKDVFIDGEDLIALPMLMSKCLSEKPTIKELIDCKVKKCLYVLDSHKRNDVFKYDVCGDFFEIHFSNGEFERVAFKFKPPYTEQQWKSLSTIPSIIDEARNLIKKGKA